MLHPIRDLAVLIAGVPLALMLLIAIIFAAARTRKLPVCPQCLRPKVRRSHRHSALEEFATMLWIAPFKCEGCLKRFYAFSRRTSPHMDEISHPRIKPRYP